MYTQSNMLENTNWQEPFPWPMPIFTFFPFNNPVIDRELTEFGPIPNHGLTNSYTALSRMECGFILKNGLSVSEGEKMYSAQKYLNS